MNWAEPSPHRIQIHWATRNGVLTVGVQSMCYAHSTNDMSRVVDAYGVALPVLKEKIEAGTLEQDLPYPIIEPVFKVR